MLVSWRCVWLALPVILRESSNSGLESDGSDSLASHLTSPVFVNESDSLEKNLSEA